MRKRFGVCISALVMAVPAGAAAADPAAAAGHRSRGLELGYNLDHVEAIAAFGDAIAADPTDANAYRLLAAAIWVALAFEQGAITVDDYLGQARSDLARAAPNPALDARFRQALGRALTLSEQRLRDHPGDADAHYLVGAASGVLASYTSTIEGRVLGSLGPARRAYREHERVLELDPQRKDAGLVVGLYRYGVAALPAPVRLMARLAGFGGGRERGVRLVEEAAVYPSDAQPSALFMLVLLYNREARYDDALRVIGELQRRYPRNRLLWLEQGGTEMRAGRPAKARAAIEEGMARLWRDGRPRAYGEEARWRYAYGTALVRLQQLQPAERELRAALAGATRDWVRGRAHKELGTVAALSGQTEIAREEYRLADQLCRADRDSDCSTEVKTLVRHVR
jgi:tetratricopeptide (TPR) repeat protein